MIQNIHKVLQLKPMKEDNPNINFQEIIKNKENYLEPTQIQSILDYFWNKEDIQMYALILTLYRTGRRISELLGKPPFTRDKTRSISNYKGLRPTDLYPKQQLIHFEILKKRPVKTKTKSGVTRTKEKLDKLRLNKTPIKELLPVDTELFTFLNTYIQTYNIGYEHRIFQTSRQTAIRKFHTAITECNIKLNLGFRNIRQRDTTMIHKVKAKPHLHTLRHSFAINLIQQNQNNPQALIILNQLLQHSSMNMTKEYTKFKQEEIKKFLDKTFTK